MTTSPGAWLTGASVAVAAAAALSAGSESGTFTAAMTYSIVREKDGKQVEISANESAEVLPGDVVKAILTTTAPD